MSINVTGDKVGYLSPNSRFVYICEWRHQGGYLIKTVIKRAIRKSRFYNKILKDFAISLHKMKKNDGKYEKLNFILIFLTGNNKK